MSPPLKKYSMQVLTGSIIRLLRYRFFLFAGLFPYLLGQSISSKFNFSYFLWGLTGVFFVLGGVETFNEYFDSQMGTDRIFSFKEDKRPRFVLYIGIICFLCAGIIGLYLTKLRGTPVIIFAIIGFFSAAFYVAPPFRWAWRGLGEIVIAFSYGPLLVCGSYYLQMEIIDKTAVIYSILGGLLIFPLAVVNEIPDYYQDRIVGKRNLVVRLGKKNAIILYGLVYLIFYILLGKEIGLLFLVTIPFTLYGLINAWIHFENPTEFIKSIRIAILTYLAGMIFLICGFQ